MRLPSLPVPERLRHAAGRRSAALVLALLLELLIALAFLFFLTPQTPERDKPARRMTTFNVGAEDRASEATRKAEKRPQPRETRKPETRPPPVEPPVQPEIKLPPGFLVMTREEFIAADIGKIRGTAPPGDRADAGAQPGDSKQVGTGPRGEPLYAAEWVREPSDAELSPYIPTRTRGHPGWGVIICRTVAGYRVEDCQELGQTPGSGYAGAVRQAAWQFRVRPPRVGGKPLVGSWVRIRVDYAVREIGGGDPPR